MADYENISSGPVDDDAMPTGEQLTAALNNIINPGASAPTTGQPPKAEPSTSTPEASQAPLVLKPGTTAAQIKAYIEKLESDPAWANANDPNHAEVHRHLRASYQALDATPEAPAPTPHVQQQRASAGRAMLQARISAIESSEAWRSAAHQDHGKVMAELRSLYEQANPSPGGPRELPSAYEAASAGGVRLPEAPKGMEGMYSDVDTSEFLVWSRIEQNIPAVTVQRIMDDYHRFMVLEGRAFTGLRDGDVQRWQKALVDDYGLSKVQTEELIRWYVRRTQEGA